MNLIPTIVILIYRKDINDRQDHLAVISTPDSKRNNHHTYRQMQRSEKIKLLKKKIKNPDEKEMYLEVSPSGNLY